MNPQAMLDGLTSYLCMVIIITVHEFGHAVAAVRLGDDTPRLQGRVTLNPIAHMDLIGTVALPLIALFLAASGTMGMTAAGFIIGWGKPVQFNLGNLRNRHTGPLIIAMAGPLMNVVIAVIAVGFIHVGNLTGHQIVNNACLNLAQLSMYLFFFNLLPIPPLDGSYVLKHFTGMSWETFHMFGRYGLFALILLLQVREVRIYLAVATHSSIVFMARVLGVV